MLPTNIKQKKIKENMMYSNFPDFKFLSYTSKLKAVSAQKGFSMAQHHKMYRKYVETLSIDL